MMRKLKWLLCIGISAVGICCTKPSPTVPKAAPKPFAVSENEGVVHEFYRDITFDEFAPSLPSGSIDSLDFDSTIQDYAIALVIAPRSADDEVALEFTTTFVTDNQEKLVKTWTVASGNKGDKVRGLFLVPKSVASAATIRSTSKTENEGAQPKRDSSG